MSVIASTSYAANEVIEQLFIDEFQSMIIVLTNNFFFYFFTLENGNKMPAKFNYIYNHPNMNEYLFSLAEP
jgi:hypothetical protein